ncbi:MAG: chromosomal replication initiator protein DnaA [Eubacteriales bacterium]|nr:chromosomal replication initiator protein DnaA [Eubacteriales bacterium]
MNEELIKQNWNTIKEHIRDEYELSDISYRTWIEPLMLRSVNEHLVTIAIPFDQSHALNYISNKYKTFFQVTISEMMDSTFEVAFVLEKDAQKEEAAAPAPKPTYGPQYESANLNPKYRFDTFVVGSNNKLAHSACLAVAESPGEAYNPLFLYGGAGLGKTHLMHSVGYFILEQNPSTKVLYVTSEQFTNEVIESIRSGNASSMAKLRDKYRTVDVLMIDDIQFIIGKESTQEEFFHTFNELHSQGKQIILSSDRPPKEMETLDERFRSRFEWGLMADIQPPDYETRMAILKRNAEATNRTLDDEILEYIATNIKSNIRELEGAFNKIFAFSRLNNVDINLDNAKEALKDIIYPDKSQAITPSKIITVVCEHYGVKATDITSRKRNAEYVLPRQIIMYLCKEYTDNTLSAIGKILGKKDHTTIIHGVSKISEELKRNEDLKNNVDIIVKKLNPPVHNG